MGTVCETPSPESRTMPVVRPDAYSERTALDRDVERGAGLNVLEHDLASSSRGWPSG